MTVFNSTLSRLQNAISVIPLIDNHAHSIFQSFSLSENYPNGGILSQATSWVMDDSAHSLAHLRMRKQLAEFMDLPTNASWSTLYTTAHNRGYGTFCQDLIKAAGIQVVLFDDSFVNEHCHSSSWHNQLRLYSNKRIVRIESLFESIVAAVGPQAAFNDYIDAIGRLASDQDVVGFKSVSAYRPGIYVQPSNIGIHYSTSSAPLQVLEQEIQRQANNAAPFRLEHSIIVQWLVNITLSIISGRGKPVQFFTGDSDNVTTSEASHLQPLIKAYPDVPFVLLHSAYSQACQAGYLATAYPNVYVDFGLAISMLSGNGQRNLLHRLMEFCPINKLMWSSGAAFRPEQFYLGALQSRQALAEVLAEYTDRQEILFEEAIGIAKQVLFENSNKLYGLRIDYAELDLSTPPDDPRQVYDLSARVLPVPLPNESGKLARIPANLDLPSSVSFIKSQGVKFIRLAWVDYVNIMRYRIIPIDRFVSLLGNKFTSGPETSSSQRIVESGLSLTRVALSMGVRGLIPAGIPISGDTDLKADFSSMWRAPFAPNHAYMMGRFFEKPCYRGGNGVSDICPRTILHRIIQRAEREFNVTFLVGFETEFNLLDQNNNPVRTGPWTSSKQLEYGPAADCVHEIAQCIMDSGIQLEIYHAESAGGQYEVVPGPLPPLQAADALVATREIIYNIARKHGYRATLSPRYFSNQTGTACHAHISVQSPRSNTPSNHPDIPDLPADLASFIAGLLDNLVSVCAFTLPIDASYSRVADGFWSGGSWVCWGRENKEAPLRLCGSGKNLRVELKSFDGIANPYLGLAAMIGAGVAGLASEKVLEMRNCLVAAASLTEQERCDMSITTRMPTQSPVLEPGLGLDMDFINTWLPESGWRVFKAARESERNSLIALKQEEGNGDLSWRELSAIVCRQYY